MSQLNKQKENADNDRVYNRVGPEECQWCWRRRRADVCLRHLVRSAAVSCVDTCHPSHWPRSRRRLNTPPTCMVKRMLIIENPSQSYKVRLWDPIKHSLICHLTFENAPHHNLSQLAGVVENSSHRKIIPTRSSTG